MISVDLVMQTLKQRAYTGAYPDASADFTAFASLVNSAVLSEMIGHLPVTKKRIAGRCRLLSDPTISTIANRAGIACPAARVCAIELWRMCEEIRCPESIGSNSVPDGVVIKLLGDTCTRVDVADRMFLVGGAITETCKTGTLAHHLIEDAKLALAAEVFLLRRGCLFFMDEEDLLEYIGHKKLLGSDLFLLPYKRQLGHVRAIVAKSPLADTAYVILGLFDNVSGAFGKYSLWLMQTFLEDFMLAGADIWSFYPILDDRTLGLRNARPDGVTQWAVQWRVNPRRVNSVKFTGKCCEDWPGINISELRLVRDCELKERSSTVD